MAEELQKYWVYLGGSVQGPFNGSDMLCLPGFQESTLVCPEASLGQWREASAEPSLKVKIAKNKSISSAEEAESQALASLLEQSIDKTSSLTDEINELKAKHDAAVEKLKEQLRTKDKTLQDALQKLEKASNFPAAEAAQPSWEALYKAYKNRAEGKLRHMAEQLGGREAELLHVRRQLQETMEKRGADERSQFELQEKTVSAMTAKIRALEARLEGAESELKACKEKLRSSLERTAEMQNLTLEEKESAERQTQQLCGEMGKYKNQLAWKERELSLLKEKCAEKTQACRELESRENLRRKEHSDVNGRLRAKLSELNNHLKSFETLKENIRALLSGRICRQNPEPAGQDKAAPAADGQDDKPVIPPADGDSILSIRRENEKISEAISMIADEIKNIHSSLENGEAGN